MTTIAASGAAAVIIAPVAIPEAIAAPPAVPETPAVPAKAAPLVPARDFLVKSWLLGNLHLHDISLLFQINLCP